MAAVPGFDAGHVMIAGLDANNRAGAIGTVSLHAMKPTCLKPRAVLGKLVCAKAPSHKHKKHKKHKKKQRRLAPPRRGVVLDGAADLVRAGDQAAPL